MSGRMITLLTATSLFVGAPLEGQVERESPPGQDEAQHEEGMMEGMDRMMGMCQMMMGDTTQMMTMHGTSSMEDGMGSEMMQHGMMGMMGPEMILSVRDVLRLTDDQVGALEELAQATGEGHMDHMEGGMPARGASADVALAVLDEEQRERLHIGMQLMHGMMGQMMGHMGQGGGSDAPDPADGHASHHR